MKANPRFQFLTKDFWAHVRCVSESVGYTVRGGAVRVPTIQQIKGALAARGLTHHHILDETDQITEYGRLLLDYFEYRARVLNEFVKVRLMTAEQARTVYEALQSQYASTRITPMNKQKGDKRVPAYFTSIINCIIDVHRAGFDVDFDPRQLTAVTRNDRPLRTFARRVDGAFPSTINPVAIWEIKEYYYSTTFGSRVADGVYETLLDGMELEELLVNEGIQVSHVLMVDAYYNWWVKGKSYLCRIIDMLHMGYVDEVLFGYEVVEALPEIVQNWAAIAKKSIPSTHE